MYLRLGTHVVGRDGFAGELADVILDPNELRVTHLVVEPTGRPHEARLVPVGLASPILSRRGTIVVECGPEELAALPESRQFAVVDIGASPPSDAQWDVGVEDAVPTSPIAAGEFGDTIPYSSTVGVYYDRVPKGSVELREASVVQYDDGKRAGRVSALVVHGDQIAEIVVRHGWLWRRRE